MRYPFQCTACGLEFEVSRPASESAAGATCPTDGAAAVRIFTIPEMGFNRPPPATASAPPSRGFSHHGHSHGPGTGHHTH
jgi:putative FmdB family regulatory protein